MKVRFGGLPGLLQMGQDLPPRPDYLFPHTLDHALDLEIVIVIMSPTISLLVALTSSHTVDARSP